MHTGLVRFFEDMRALLSEYNQYKKDKKQLKALLASEEFDELLCNIYIFITLQGT